MFDEKTREIRISRAELYVLDTLLLNVIDFQKERQKRLEKKIKRKVRDAVKRLPDLERIIIYLDFWKGFDFREIARLINLSDEETYNHREAALKQLKRRLCDLGIEEEYSCFLQNETV